MKKCLLCGEYLSNDMLLSFDNMPASAQNLPSDKELDNETGISLTLHQCPYCGLVQFDCEPVEYYRDVIRSGGYSTTMYDLRYKQYKYFIEKYNLEKKKIIEVGCGQGEFLQVLNEFDIQGFGIENRSDLVAKARENDLKVMQGFTDTKDTFIENGPFDAFLSFNFLEHQPNPNIMLRAIYNNLSEGGMGLITVPSLEYILENDGYYELIRDHIAYYSFDTLRFACEKNGFKVLEQEMVNRDTISMIVRKRSSICVNKLKTSYTVINDEVNSFIDELDADDKKLAIWGASHQGFTVASTARLRGRIEYIIDSAPFKQGLYAPASHIPIISPEEAVKRPVDAIIIIAPGYTEEIAHIIYERFRKDVIIKTIKSNHLETVEVVI